MRANSVRLSVIALALLTTLAACQSTSTRQAIDAQGPADDDLGAASEDGTRS